MLNNPARHAVFALCAFASLHAQVATVRGRVEVDAVAKAKAAALPSTVVWLTPIPSAGNEASSSLSTSPSSFKLTQKNKTFEPHLLVVPAGTVVEFPNRDPFFHNVFSLFEGKRFDLGLYEAGTSRNVHFDRVGISYIFCNIHPEMSAVVITLNTPYYALLGADGQFTLPDVAYGRYLLRVWSEGMGPESAQPAGHEITVSEGATSLGVIRVPSVGKASLAHKNKYGREYDAPAPDNPVYPQRP